VKELREDMNQSFVTQSEFVRNEIDLAKAQNGRLLNDQYEKIHVKQ